MTQETIHSFKVLIEDTNPHICHFDTLLELMDEAPLTAELDSGWLTGIFVARKYFEQAQTPIYQDLLMMKIIELDNMIESAQSQFELGFLSGLSLTRKMHAVLAKGDFHHGMTM